MQFMGNVSPKLPLLVQSVSGATEFGSYGSKRSFGHGFSYPTLYYDIVLLFLIEKF